MLTIYLYGAAACNKRGTVISVVGHSGLDILVELFQICFPRAKQVASVRTLPFSPMTTTGVTAKRRAFLVWIDHPGPIAPNAMELVTDLA